MEDHGHQQHSYHSLGNGNLASRSGAASHYQSAMPLATSQPSIMAIKTGSQHPHSLDTMGSMHYQNNLPMWHHVPSQPINLAAMSMVQQRNQQHDPAAMSMMLQSQGLRYYPTAPVKMYAQAMQQPQNSQFYHASVACSKRFSEEEKQKLEKVFTDETQKPSTSRKRQLAEELGCPVPKVNNWFQNRRAREKQMHRVQAYEASQAADRASASTAESADAPGDDDEEDAGGSDVDSIGSQTQALKSSGSRFSETDESSADRDSDGSVTDSSAISPAAAVSKAEENAAQEEGLSIKTEPRLSPPTQIPSFEIQTTSGYDDNHGMVSLSPEAYEDSQDGFDSLQDQYATSYSSFSGMPGLGVMDGSLRHDDFFTSSSMMGQRTPTITTNMVGHDEMETMSSRRPSDLSNFSGMDSLSPDMIQQHSPIVDQTPLQESPNSSLASRRKIRPPQRLNSTALRNYPNGPKTGIDGPKRSDMYGTMRRAASANGPLSGKIFKSGPPVSPLSPRSFDPSFLEHLAKTSSLTGTSLKETSSVSPIDSCSSPFERRYLSAEHPGLSIPHRASTLSLNSCFGESIALSPSISEHPRESSFVDTASASFQQQQHQHHHHQQQHFQQPHMSRFNSGNVSPDEAALMTPGLSHIGSELEFPMSLSAPRYVESEPTTPSYVPMPAVTSAAAPMSQLMKMEMNQQHADIFPWSSRSPDQQGWHAGAVLGHAFGEPQSQTFTFQPNITPQNFNSPTGI